MTTVIVPAAGKGARLESPGPKALTDLGGRPLIDWVLSAASGIADHLVIVIQPQEQPAFEEWASKATLSAPLSWAFQPAPEGSLSAVRIGAECALEEGRGPMIVVWADQVGVGTSTLCAVADAIAGEQRVLAVPLAETASPYVWVELDDLSRISRVMRRRDGDVPPPVGLADLGVFGLSRSLAAAFVEMDEQAFSPSDLREVDFTYGLPRLSRMADKTYAPLIATQNELIAVNTPEDLVRARNLLGSRND